MIRLAEKDQAVIDIEVLSLMQQVFIESKKRGFGSNQVDVKLYLATLWERSLKARSKDEAFVNELFFICFQQRDWGNAQKVDAR